MSPPDESDAPPRLLSEVDLVQKLDLHGIRRVVSLGAGAETIGEALATALPEAQLVLVDQEEAIQAARARLPADMLEGRILLVARDFIADGIPLVGDQPGHYDLALLSSIVFRYGEGGSRTLLGRVYEALEPGGLVVIRERLRDLAGSTPADAAPSSIRTRDGDRVTFERIRSLLHDAGFGEVELELTSGLITARRA